MGCNSRTERPRKTEIGTEIGSPTPHVSAAGEDLGAHRGGEWRGHIVSPCAQLVFDIKRQCPSSEGTINDIHVIYMTKM